MVPALEDLVEALCKLPAIGKKSAWRLAMHLMERPIDEVRHLSTCLEAVKTKIVTCKRCCNYSETEICPVCSSSARDAHQLCVVERPVDVFTLESSGRFRGVYHVLGGVLSPINGITADKLHLRELVVRVETEKPSEIILALGGSADAETTSLYLAKILGDKGGRITRLARGMPAGMELEYVDQITLTQALNERTEIHYR